jgi:NAD+ diphosphatase
MIGCHAETAMQDVVIDRSELDDARWFDREEIALMLARKHPQGLTAPPSIAIAHYLMRGFAEGGSRVLDAVPLESWR